MLRDYSTDLLDKVLEAISNNTRRKILKVLISEGALSFSDIMRRCGIKDASTLKHHLDKLKPLVIKSKNGSYRATKLGVIVNEFIENLNEYLSTIQVLTKSERPLIIIKLSSKPYLVLSLIAMALSLTTYVVFTYVLLTYVLLGLTLILLLLAVYTKFKKIIIGSHLVFIESNLLMSNSKTVIRGELIGVGEYSNFFLRLFNHKDLVLVIRSKSRINLIKIGPIEDSMLSMYSDELEKLIVSSELKELSTKLI